LTSASEVAWVKAAISERANHAIHHMEHTGGCNINSKNLLVERKARFPWRVHRGAGVTCRLPRSTGKASLPPGQDGSRQG